MNEKFFIDGCLPCMTADTCPLQSKCGRAMEYKSPNTKKLLCLVEHIETLAYELHKRDNENAKAPLSDYAYQMAWIMHNEIAKTAELLVKWEEPKHDSETFLAVYNAFCRFVENNGINFLRETHENLRAVASAFAIVAQ